MIMDIIHTTRNFIKRPQDFATGSADGCVRLSGGSTEIYVPPLEEILNLAELGSGGFATVYALPNEKLVMKVCKDGSYRAYANFIRAHQSNPYLPRIYYRTRAGQYDIYILERLVPQNDWEGDMTHWCNEAANAVRSSTSRFFKLTCPHLQQIRDLFGHSNFNDCYGSNIMLRRMADGTFHPVFSDPTAGYEGSPRRSYAS